MSSQNSRLKPKQKGQLRRLIQQAAPGSRVRQVIVTPPGEAKMSEVFWDFMEPYTSGSETRDQLKKLLTIGMAAWGASLSVSRAERNEMIQELVATQPPEFQADMRAFIEELVRRKLQYFSSCKRPIMSFDLTMTPSGEPHLTVLSLFNPP